MNHKFMEQDSNEWSTDTMMDFIVFQNTFRYDGNPPIKHGCYALMQFSWMDDEKQIEKFTEVYNQYLKTLKEPV